MRISFDLSDSDLQHFKLIMQQAKNACADLPDSAIIEAAQKTLHDIKDGEVPDFICDRLEQLNELVGMLTDTDWGLPDNERRRVLDALSYFTDPDDLIPDDIPGVGYLDDAIMVELVSAELAEELRAYRDFCEFRDAAAERDETADRSAWLRARRTELQTRMRKRRGPLGFL